MKEREEKIEGGSFPLDLDVREARWKSLPSKTASARCSIASTFRRMINNVIVPFQLLSRSSSSATRKLPTTFHLTTTIQRSLPWQTFFFLRKEFLSDVTRFPATRQEATRDLLNFCNTILIKIFNRQTVHSLFYNNTVQLTVTFF